MQPVEVTRSHAEQSALCLLLSNKFSVHKFANRNQGQSPTQPYLVVRMTLENAQPTNRPPPPTPKFESRPQGCTVHARVEGAQWSAWPLYGYCANQYLFPASKLSGMASTER